jgi:hypothetical protein
MAQNACTGSALSLPTTAYIALFCVLPTHACMLRYSWHPKDATMFSLFAPACIVPIGALLHDTLLCCMTCGALQHCTSRSARQTHAVYTFCSAQTVSRSHNLLATILDTQDHWSVSEANCSDNLLAKFQAKITSLHSRA